MSWWETRRFARTSTRLTVSSNNHLQVMGTRIEHAGAVIQMEPKAAYVTRKRNERHAKPLSPYNAGNANGVAAAGAGTELTISSGRQSTPAAVLASDVRKEV